MSTATLPAAGLFGKIVEVCIVTADYKATMDGLWALGIGPFQVYDFDASTVRERRWRGGAGDFGLKVGFARVGELTVEVMQPTGGRSLMAEYLERGGGRAGVQHVAFDMGGGAVPMAERKARMRARGVEPAMEGVWMGRRGSCHFCFFDTEAATGTVFETIEFSQDWEDPECEWYPQRPDA